MKWRYRIFGGILFVIAGIAGGQLASLGFAEADDNAILYLSFDEGSGCTTTDSSTGHVFNLESNCPTDGPQWVPGQYGSALSFDGNDDYIIDHSGADLLNTQTALTTAMWIKSNAVGIDNGVITGHDPSTNPNDKVFGIRYDKRGSNSNQQNVIKATINTTGGRMKIESSEYAQTTDWQHVALVWENGQELKLYINGSLDTPTFNSPAYTGSVIGATKLVIGKGIKDTGNKGWDGLIDEVVMYDTALTAQEIQNLYQNGVSAPPPVPDKKISPILECVEDKGNGRYAAFFGYYNRNATTVNIPIGSDNRFTPSPQNMGQPEDFASGRKYADFCFNFDGSNKTWTLKSPNGQQSTATASTNPANACSEVPFTCYDDQDGDGIFDEVENSIGSNPLSDDSDNDGVKDQYEASSCVGVETCTPIDSDSDGTSDILDVDDDGDGVNSNNENNDPNSDGNPDDALDTDSDGAPDYLDDLDNTDTDGDGIYDTVEQTIGSDPNSTDSDNDGSTDEAEAPSCVGVSTCSPQDTDSDGTPDIIDDTDDSGLHAVTTTDPDTVFKDEQENPISSTDQSVYIWDDLHLNSYLEINDDLDTSTYAIGSNGAKSWFHFGTSDRSHVNRILLIFPKTTDHIYARVCPNAANESEIFRGCPGEIRLTPANPSSGGYTLINLSDPDYWYVEGDDIQLFSTGGEGVADRIISHWRFDENGGTDALDSVSTNHGVIFGAPAWEPGVSGSALHFNGYDDRVIVPDDDSLDLTTKGSIQAWVRADTYTQFGGIVHKGVRRDFLDEAYSLQFWNPIGTLRMFLFETATNYIFAETANVLQINQWYHVVATWDENTIKLYLNGQLDDEIPNTFGTTRSTDGDFVIGAQLDEVYNSTWGHVGFDGIIDEVQLYNYALSSAEILSLYNTISISEDALFEIIDDTYLDPATPDGNFGANDSLNITQDTPTLMRFDVSPIPAGSTVYSATLRMEALQDVPAGQTVTLHEILSGNAGWIEGNDVGLGGSGNEPTWNNKYPGSATSWAGSQGMGTADTDYDSTIISQVTGPMVTGETYEWTIDPNLVMQWVNDPFNNQGILLRTDSTDLFSFASSEHPNDDTHPVLFVDYGFGTGCNILYSDNFEDADVSDWNHTWDAGTEWTVADLGGDYEYSHVGSVYSQTQSTFSTPNDYVYTGQMTVNDHEIQGIMFRYQDDDNFWRLVFEFGRARIRGMVDGTWVTAYGGSSDTAFVPTVGETYELKVQVRGDEIRAKWWLEGDSEPADWMIYSTDDRILSGGIGLVNNGDASYDNLQVTDCFDTNSLPPEIELTFPDGGETLYAGTSADITWDSFNTSGTLTLQYSSDGFVSDINTISSTVPDTGSYTITVPSEDGSSFTMRLFDNANAGIFDESDAVFSMTTACMDTDSDGICDTVETAIGTDINSNDSDGDGVYDQFEVPSCVGVSNCTPEDTDLDGTNDALDNDDDNDGVLSGDEGNDPNGDGDPADADDSDGDGTPDYLDDNDNTDTDGDGIFDHVETTLGTDLNSSDSDGDGVDDQYEAPGCVGVHLCTPIDTDTDATPDILDTDDDDDGIPSANEQNDPNGDGDPSDALDSDGDTIPDYLDTDPNGVDIIATKIECLDETDLPNWGSGGPNISATTASDFLATHPNCSLKEGWEFQYGLMGPSNPGDNSGEAPAPDWITFGPTDASGEVQVYIPYLNGATQISMREIPGNEHIQFTGAGGADVTSEFYCADDVANYDNFDFIRNPNPGDTFYCVGFNALDPALCTDTDGDTVCDVMEDQLGTNPNSEDSDGDGVYDQYEIPTCVETYVCDPTDTDGDGQIDALDTDDDGDGRPSDREQNDPNGDGNPDDAVHRDNDGIPAYLDDTYNQYVGGFGGSGGITITGGGSGGGSVLGSSNSSGSSTKTVKPEEDNADNGTDPESDGNEVIEEQNPVIDDNSEDESYNNNTPEPESAETLNEDLTPQPDAPVGSESTPETYSETPTGETTEDSVSDTPAEPTIPTETVQPDQPAEEPVAESDTLPPSTTEPVNEQPTDSPTDSDESAEEDIPAPVSEDKIESYNEEIGEEFDGDTDNSPSPNDESDDTIGDILGETTHEAITYTDATGREQTIPAPVSEEATEHVGEIIDSSPAFELDTDTGTEGDYVADTVLSETHMEDSLADNTQPNMHSGEAGQKIWSKTPVIAPYTEPIVSTSIPQTLTAGMVFQTMMTDDSNLRFVFYALAGALLTLVLAWGIMFAAERDSARPKRRMFD